jgi:hypothetical protein
MSSTVLSPCFICILPERSYPDTKTRRIMNATFRPSAVEIQFSVKHPNERCPCLGEATEVVLGNFVVTMLGHQATLATLPRRENTVDAGSIPLLAPTSIALAKKSRRMRRCACLVRRPRSYVCIVKQVRIPVRGRIDRGPVIDSSWQSRCQCGPPRCLAVRHRPRLTKHWCSPACYTLRGCSST